MQPPRADPARRRAGKVERGRVGAAAEPADGLLGDADARGGRAGEAGVGERLDIVALPGGREAVDALAHRHRLEIERAAGLRFGRVGGRAGLIGRRLGGESVLVMFHTAAWNT